MAFTRPEFTPGGGWMDAETFPTRPYSEEDTRRMLNLLHGQLREYISEILLAELEREGAAHIGSPALTDLDGTGGKSVWELLCYLAQNLTDFAAGTIPDGTVTDAKLSGNPEALKMRANAHMSSLLIHPLSISTAGSDTAYTAETGRSVTALSRGMELVVLFHTDCGEAPTPKIDGLVPVALCLHDGENIPAGCLKADRPYRFVFDGTVFRGELALQKADAANAVLSGTARVAAGGTLTVAAGAPSALTVKNISILTSSDAIPELSEGDVVLIVD